MSSFDELNFRRQVQSSLDVVKRILDVNRKPVFASDVQHQYQDKYILAEMLSNMTLASTLYSLQTIGVDDSSMQKMLDWSECRSVTLSLRATERCNFVRKTTRDVDSSTKHVVETSFGVNVTSKTVTTITEYFWKFSVVYELVCYRGTGESDDDSFVVTQKEGCTEVKTPVDKAPRAEVTTRNAIDVNITPLLRKNKDTGGRQPFEIRREASSCHTPRRNAQVEQLIRTLNNLNEWCSQVHSYFTDVLFPMEQDNGLDLGALTSREVFVPVLPIMIEPNAPPRECTSPTPPAAILTSDTSSHRTSRVRRMGSQDLTSTTGLPVGGLQVSRSPEVTLGVTDIGAFLDEEARSLREKCDQIDAAFPPRTATAAIITAAEARLLVALSHMRDVCHRYVIGVDYIEGLLWQQLVAAIGKEVQASDFAAYMRFHNNKVFLPPYRPKPFCYAVRRSELHAPEGVLSIEEMPADGRIADPIYTVASSAAAGNLMQFPINAAVQVSFGGERHLHAYLLHKFSTEVGVATAPPQLTLRAEARQFSSFIVMIGRISSASTFDPKYAMIVQNKDDLRIPLDLETIPSAKEFKDAISSLSPEQQRFAKAFRGMQLESTLFGVLVIQIKPQLEKVLNLPPDSLTKEIALTQDLMEMFVKYQIPSDLMSFDGDETCSSREKVDRVKTHVSALGDMINRAKEADIAAARQETQYARGGMDVYELTMSCMAPPPPGGVPRSIPVPRAPMRTMATPTPQRQLQQQNSPAQPSSDQGTPSRPVNKPTLEPEGGDDSVATSTDYTRLPRLLDSRLEALDKEGSVRPTIITAGDVWTKKSKKSLLAEATTAILHAQEQRSERTAAFDLLDALSKSGGICVDDAQLHVVLAATHCFDRSLMDTIVQKNVNPIEKVELSTMIMATMIHDQPVERLVSGDQLPRLLEFSPALESDASAAVEEKSN